MSKKDAGTQIPQGSAIAAEFDNHTKNKDQDTYAYSVSLVGTELITDLGNISGEVSAFFNGLVAGKVLTMVDTHLASLGLTRDTTNNAAVVEFIKKMRDFETAEDLMKGIGSVTVLDHKGGSHIYFVNVSRKLVEKETTATDGEL